MAQFTIYKSTDTGAPTLDGTAGSLVNLLDKCLVTGYGSKTAAGWTKPFTGTNKAAFKQGSGSNGHYLRVQDDGPGGHTTQEARITGYETMSDVDTGTGPFPTAAQGVGSIAMVVARKSATANATARTWLVAADSRTVYAFVLSGDTAATYKTFGFGEFYSLVNSDNYRTFMIGRHVEASSSVGNDNLAFLGVSLGSQLNGNFISRGHTGVGGSVIIGKHSDYVKLNGNTAFAGTLPYPNPSDGGLYLSQVWITDPTTVPANGVRGRLRGIWAFLHAHASAITDLDTVTGVGELSGKSFILLKTVADSNGIGGILALETSATLETN